jgi:DNA replication protein DnaC
MITEKPASYICPDCGAITEPRLITFPNEHWSVPKACLTCHEQRTESDKRAANMRSVDSLIARLDYILLDRGFTPKVLQEAQIEQVPEKQRCIRILEASAYVFGPAGTGKSEWFVAETKRVAMDILSRARTEGVAPTFHALPYFANASTLLRRLHFASIGQSEDGETYDHLMKSFIHFPVLILDDIGARRSTAFIEDVLYEIIDARDNYLRPTFFTSNYSLRELANRIKPRTVSRIAGMTNKHVYFVGSADRRLIAT